MEQAITVWDLRLKPSVPLHIVRDDSGDLACEVLSHPGALRLLLPDGNDIEASPDEVLLWHRKGTLSSVILNSQPMRLDPVYSQALSWMKRQDAPAEVVQEFQNWHEMQANGTTSTVFQKLWPHESIRYGINVRRSYIPDAPWYYGCIVEFVGRREGEEKKEEKKVPATNGTAEDFSR